MTGSFIDPNDFRSTLYDVGYNRYDDDRVSLHDLNGSQALMVFTALLTKFKEQMEEAKMRCEDEGDDTSLGEYISLKSVVEQTEAHIQYMMRQQYSRSMLDSALKGSPGFDTYRMLSQRGKY